MRKVHSLFLAGLLLTAGCAGHDPSPAAGGQGAGLNRRAQVQAENQLFLSQKSFDPWVLVTTDPAHTLPAYIADDGQGAVMDAGGCVKNTYRAGDYSPQGQLQAGGALPCTQAAPASAGYQQSLDLREGLVTTVQGGKQTTAPAFSPAWQAGRPAYWKKFWQTSDIEIDGDPEAQQATHANMFNLASSACAHSIAPMGLSSIAYGGHIFWDAEIWMFPALIAQHPELAKSMIDYRYKLLPMALKNAAAHGYKGAEYPWESAADGKEEAPAEFAQERHITADVAYAAWQYYLWTGDKAYLKNEGYPILSATADYWLSRATKDDTGAYHIKGVLSPDETAGVVSDDAWTNGVVRYNLRAAAAAPQSMLPAGIESEAPVEPVEWLSLADKLTIPFDKAQGIYLEHAGVDTKRMMAKQADTQMLIYPLNVPMSDAVAGKTLDFSIAHTIPDGPAMNSCIDATIAARLGRAKQSLDLFHDSYRPFMRGPWDAFSEKRTTDNVYFCTGMGGCLQTVLYGFAGLNVVGIDDLGLGPPKGRGKLIAKVDDAALYCDPHLPPGWTRLVVKGVHFRGSVYNITIGAGNTVQVAKGG